MTLSCPPDERLHATSSGARGRRARWLSAVGVTLSAACAGTVQPSLSPVPAAEGQQLASALEESSRLEGSALYRFDWSLSERGTRMVSGQGVARTASPYRARLDLFNGNIETVARAILIDAALSLPPGVPEEIEDIIPPSSLLWAALGVFHPGPDATLQRAERAGETLELRYDIPGGRQLRYIIEGGLVRQVQLLQGGGALHEISLIPAPGQRYPQEAVYRNLAAYRELKLITRSVENVDSHPAEIWLNRP